MFINKKIIFIMNKNIMDKNSFLTRRQMLGSLGLAGLSVIGCPSGGGGNGGGDGLGYFSVVLYPTADTYITSEEPSRNFGGEQTIHTGEIHLPGRRDASFRGFVKFNLSTIPHNAIIDNAIFSLTSIQALSQIQPIGTVYIDKVTGRDWQEHGLTYNIALDFVEFISSTRTTLDGRIHDWDVKTAVRDWHLGDSPNYGFSIKTEDIDDGYGGDDSPAAFISRELASQVGQIDLGPTLTIDYRA